MKLFGATCVFFAALSTASWARIDETRSQCIDRYGPVIEKPQTELPQSDPDAAKFSKNGLAVIVEFHNDKAWRIIFRKPKLSTTEVESLLSANSASITWSPPLRYGDREYRLSADKKRISITRFTANNEIAQIEIILREYSDQLHANALLPPVQPGTTDATEANVNPLPGF